MRELHLLAGSGSRVDRILLKVSSPVRVSGGTAWSLVECCSCMRDDRHTGSICVCVLLEPIRAVCICPSSFGHGCSALQSALIQQFLPLDKWQTTLHAVVSADIDVQP